MRPRSSASRAEGSFVRPTTPVGRSRECQAGRTDRSGSFARASAMNPLLHLGERRCPDGGPCRACRRELTVSCRVVGRALLAGRHKQGQGTNKDKLSAGVREMPAAADAPCARSRVGAPSPGSARCEACRAAGPRGDPRRGVARRRDRHSRRRGAGKTLVMDPSRAALTADIWSSGVGWRARPISSRSGSPRGRAPRGAQSSRSQRDDIAVATGTRARAHIGHHFASQTSFRFSADAGVDDSAADDRG